MKEMDKASAQYHEPRGGFKRERSGEGVPPDRRIGYWARATVTEPRAVCHGVKESFDPIA